MSGSAGRRNASSGWPGALRGWGGERGGRADGSVANLAKIRYLKPGDDRAALVHISEDGTKAAFDPKKDFFKMPGGGIKFSVRYDPVSKACIGP